MRKKYLLNCGNSALVSIYSSISIILFFLQKYLIDRICNVTHAYNHQNITYGQELIIELTYNTPYPGYYGIYGLCCFQTGDTKFERFLPKNQHTQRKVLNFENWINEVLKNLSFKNQLFSSSHSAN